MTRRRDERGSAALEAAILAPGLLILIAVILYAGRVALAGQSVQHAADQAAREASISRTGEQARRVALDQARRTLAQEGLDCSSTSIQLGTAGFGSRVGEAASVRAQVTCVIKVSDLSLPLLPGSKTVREAAVSPIDTYRERS